MHKLKRAYIALGIFSLILSLILVICFPEPTGAHPEDAQDHNYQVNGATFYGPGFYGKRTACGQIMQRDSQWVAVSSSKRSEFPCGTLIRFEWHGREIVVPVLDVCPGCKGNHLWDLSAGTCYYLQQEGRPPRCNKNPIAWTR